MLCFVKEPHQLFMSRSGQQHKQTNKQEPGDTAPSRAMGTMKNSLKCPICQDLFVDPVSLPCAHNFCLTCIRAVWNADVSEEEEEEEEGPFFCPECQIIFPSRVPLEVNTDLQSQVKDQACHGCNQGSSESNGSR